MPQLTPFFFLNQFSSAFLVLTLLILILSLYILPNFLTTQIARKFLSNKNF